MQELSDFICYLPRSISDGINYCPNPHVDDDDEYGEQTPYWIDPKIWWHTAAYELVSEEYGAFMETKMPFANHLVIDMEQSDESLRESFDSVLKSLRGDPEYTRNEMDDKGELQFNKWSRYSILAYLDLEQWSLENNYNIPNKVYAEALSQFRLVGEDNVRKTVRKSARSAITRSTLMRLESFVASRTV